MCFVIFELNKFIYPQKEFLNPRTRSKFNPRPHAKQCGFPRPPRKCGYPQPARVYPPRAGLYCLIQIE